jgi:beta-galactosidase
MRGQARTRICLNGEWDFSPDYSGLSPQEASARDQWEAVKLRVPSSWRSALHPEQEFQPYDLFGYPTCWNQAQSGVIHRTFALQKNPGERCFLIFNGVMQSFAVFVNGRLVVTSQESFLPVEVDITSEQLQDGENDLRVWCGPYETIEKPYGSKVLTPSGSWFAGMCRGIWQDVYLELRPLLYLEDVFVKTSVRNQRIEVQAEISNSNESNQTFRLRARIYDGQVCIHELLSDQEAVRPGCTQVVGLDSTWISPRLWSPEHPDLYDLVVELYLDEEIIDQVRKRFGFREIWLEQQRFILNGIRLNLRGDAWHYQGFVQQTKEFALNWFRACREAGVNLVRLHAMPYPEFYLEAADEAGMLIIDESAIYGSGKAMQADHPVFLENCRQHLRRLVRRDRSHPSVVIWSMQNEMRWVDGRDGYKEAMRGLTRAIKELDPTRPVSYDGDNRLVDPDDMEIISMHYNIDGTVGSWKKDKPLIFGEHGPWHYVSPQVCTGLTGPAAYLSYESCQESMGLNEELFNEYARKEQVTGLTPFNIVNYNMRSFPPEVQALQWGDLTTPGVKPCKIPAHSLTINNGLVVGQPLFIPNPSWKHLQASFKPVAIFRDEYDLSFFGGRNLLRSFSIYNDTERTAEACLEYTFLNELDEVLDTGRMDFQHLPGKRVEWKHTFLLPDVLHRSACKLILTLFNASQQVHQLSLLYQIYPRQPQKLNLSGRHVILFGDQGSFDAVAQVADGLTWKSDVTRQVLAEAEVVILGKDFQATSVDILSELERFVMSGGFLILLEQSFLSLGDTSLSGKRFFSAFITDLDHPIFSGLSDDDLRFWGVENIHAGDAGWLVQNALNKPVNGDFRILLECGEGNFGWGGQLWTPLVEYAIGQGRILINQVELVRNSSHIPQAQCLLMNMLKYTLSKPACEKRDTWLLADEGSESELFLRSLGIRFEMVSYHSDQAGLNDLQPSSLILVDPEFSNKDSFRKLRQILEQGAQVLVLPCRLKHAGFASELAGKPVELEPAEVYQVCAQEDTATRGIPASDLFWIEKVTYSPASLQNMPICQYSLVIGGAKVLLESVHNPWHDYFIRGLDAEFQKVAIATMNAGAAFHPYVYGLCTQVGKGILFFSQVRLVSENVKSRRFYTRLLANLGASYENPFLTLPKTPLDSDIPYWMALEQPTFVDKEAMLAYFSAADYVLNNLGEGVYGWMTRLEKSRGAIRVTGSAGKTWFLTLFIESAENHNPLKRASNELPDSSIVPDLFVITNCSFSLYENGRLLARQEASEGIVKIDDVLLEKGINRLLIVCQAGAEDLQLNAWFRNKYGDPVSGLRYLLTLD